MVTIHSLFTCPEASCEEPIISWYNSPIPRCIVGVLDCNIPKLHKARADMSIYCSVYCTRTWPPCPCTMVFQTLSESKNHTKLLTSLANSLSKNSGKESKYLWITIEVPSDSLRTDSLALSCFINLNLCDLSIKLKIAFSFILSRIGVPTFWLHGVASWLST